MKNLLQQALFVIPIAALIVAPLVIDHRNKSISDEGSNVSINNNSLTKPFVSYPDITFDNPHVRENKEYAMLEPFSEHVPFDFSGVMQQPMNPFMWMQMMVNMMNYMHMTEFMNQMTAMSMHMMNPAMLTTPHMHPNFISDKTLQPMDPVEYEKWYQQQQEKLNIK